MTDWFDKAFGFDLFTGMFGSLEKPPDSVALRILKLDCIPTYDTGLQAAFRRRVMELHPDLNPDTYSAVPGANEAVIKMAETDSSVQEAKWARDYLLSKVEPDPANKPPKPPQRPEHAAFDAARDAILEPERAAQEARIEKWQAAQRDAERDDVTATRVVPPRAGGRARRPVTRGCAGCGKTFEPGEEIWRVRTLVRTTWPPTKTKRRYCTTCGEKEAWRSPRWRSRCARCDRPLVYANDSWYFGLDVCACPEPRLMPYPVNGDEDARRCVLCGHWPMWLEDWACSPACRKAIRRAETREPIPERKCEQCRELLDGGRADARYCSPACRQKAYRQRRPTGGTP